MKRLIRYIPPAVALLMSLFSMPLLAQLSTRPALDIANRLELFTDGQIIEHMNGTRLELHAPTPAGAALQFDRPYEGPYAAYVTILHDEAAHLYRMYYRGILTRETGKLHEPGAEVTCYAESPDGIRWTRPALDMNDVQGSRTNNVLLAHDRACHNFAPFIDLNPKSTAHDKYKALGSGGPPNGLVPFASADGIHWKKLAEKPVITKGAFDSQNVAFWSPSERMYVCYFRTFRKVNGGEYRWISRTTSPDFLNWSEPVEMSMGDIPPEQYYTNQTQPYYRAPHLYIATPARLMIGRRVVPPDQEKALGVPAIYASDCSDALFMTTRGSNRFDRLFLESFVRPGPGLGNWVSRTNYPACGIVPTGAREMSMYVQREYTLAGHHLERLILRMDGFVSVHAGNPGGSCVTRTLTHAGTSLVINLATSAAGEVRVELLDPDGRPLDGHSADDCDLLVGDEIETLVKWKGKSQVPANGKPLRIRFYMKDADLYSLRFK